MQAEGAAVVGRRMYDVTGGWGGSSPFGMPCIVVTHRLDQQPEPASGFEFVERVEAAIDRAREIAGDEDVVIGGGASIAQQALRAGLVDELHLHIAPRLLGAGARLFEGVAPRELVPTQVIGSRDVTHIRYRLS